MASSSKNAESKSDAQLKSFPLRRLPIELRENIYRFISPDVRSAQGMLVSCHQIQNEAQEVFLRGFDFNLPGLRSSRLPQQRRILAYLSWVLATRKAQALENEESTRPAVNIRLEMEQWQDSGTSENEIWDLSMDVIDKFIDAPMVEVNFWLAGEDGQVKFFSEFTYQIALAISTGIQRKMIFRIHHDKDLVWEFDVEAGTLIVFEQDDGKDADITTTGLILH
ncbi:MAG: hypothetical protein M1821_003542 [Bathelium mastoideum]|nr:MAG: hypothetical protein M1821_003542 [Bathelium mastoideum]KAI9682629.1 MAG: hypothetical protein M1822_006927 [Bathelium mastoideum]